MANFYAQVVDLQITQPLKSFPGSFTQDRKLTFGRVASFCTHYCAARYHLTTNMSLPCSERSNVMKIFQKFFYYEEFQFLFFPAGVFPIPDYLNKSVVSLLCHMLQTDPMKRATAEDIHKHEWFLKDIATYLFPDRDVDIAIIDHDALQTVCEKFSVEAKEIEDVLQSGDYTNPLAIAYRLIIDNKIFEEKHSIEEFR